jgi:VanZ family protein
LPRNRLIVMRDSSLSLVNRPRSIGMLKIIPMLVVMGIIFYLSNQPGDSFHLPDLPQFDKFLHAVAYGVLAATVLFAVPVRVKTKSLLITAIVAVLVCFFYGISDEFHQSFIPGRSVSGGDVAADVCGASVVAWFWLRRTRNGQEKV